MGTLFSQCCHKDAANYATPVYDPDSQKPLKSQDSLRNQIGWEDFKGFKSIKDINEIYSLLEKLGQGSFGEVVKAEHMKASVDCAVKKIPKSKINEH